MANEAPELLLHIEERIRALKNGERFLREFGFVTWIERGRDDKYRVNFAPRVLLGGLAKIAISMSFVSTLVNLATFKIVYTNLDHRLLPFRELICDYEGQLDDGFFIDYRALTTDPLSITRYTNSDGLRYVYSIANTTMFIKKPPKLLGSDHLLWEQH